MKNSSSNQKSEMEKLKQALSAAKQSRKHSQAAYKAQLKSMKASLKPLKAALQHAEKLEKDAKSALKSFKKGSKSGSSKSKKPTLTVEAPKERKKPGPKPRVKEAAAEPKMRGPKPASRPRAAGTGDDLTKVKGVGDKVADMLRANGIRSYSDMASTSVARYKELLKANGMSQFRNPTNWASLASELSSAPAETEAPKERRKPGPKPKVKEAAAEPKKRGPKPSSRPRAAGTGDDLTKVKGVGDKVADMLRANGIRSYSDMASTSVARYKELLKANGMSQFRNPTNWASLASDLSSAPAETEAPKERRKPGPKPKVKEATAEPKKRGPKPASRPRAAGTGDDLTKVKGVGDKVADMLRANGIRSYSDMASTSVERYKELLKANGMSQFRNPTNWASLASELSSAPAETEAPKERRKPGPKPKIKEEVAAEPKKRGPKPKASPAGPAAQSKIAKDPNKEDDLTLVRGVGSKVAEMLKENGIRTYADMANTSVEQLKDLLKANNMGRFRDPSNWPALAAEMNG